jgi:hypothetical protein
MAEREPAVDRAEEIIRREVHAICAPDRRVARLATLINQF